METESDCLSMSHLAQTSCPVILAILATAFVCGDQHESNTLWEDLIA